MKIRYLRQTELDALYKAVPKNLDRYREGDFSYLEADSSFYFEGDTDIDAAKFAGIQHAHKDDEDVQNCLAMYELLKLTPYQAREERIWVYLTHTWLLDYSRARWSIPEDDEAAVAYIQNHFFARTKRQVERENAASRLWWMAHLCSRLKHIPPTDGLTWMLFKSDVRANIIERPTLSRSTAVFSAIVELLGESFNGKKALFVRETFREFMKILNDRGGYVLLDALDHTHLSQALRQIVTKELGVAEI